MRAAPSKCGLCAWVMLGFSFSDSWLFQPIVIIRLYISKWELMYKLILKIQNKKLQVGIKYRVKKTLGTLPCLTPTATNLLRKLVEKKLRENGTCMICLVLRTLCLLSLYKIWTSVYKLVVLFPFDKNFLADCSQVFGRGDHSYCTQFGQFRVHQAVYLIC